jgi:rod shape determining protein RodA
MNNQRSFFFNVDWVTVFIYLALCTIGLFNIRAAVFDPDHAGFLDMHTRYGSQFVYLMIAFVVAIIILLLESRFLSALAPAFYVITVLLLIIVLIPGIGRNVGGNQAWIDLGFMRLQPSEFAKYTTCLLLARYLSGTNIKVTDIKSFFIVGAIILLPMLLIKLQPDDGSTLVFLSLIFVLYREGLSPYFLIAFGLLILLFVLSLVLPHLWYLIVALSVIGLLLAWFNRRNRQLAIGLLIGTVLSIGFVYAIRPLYTKGLKAHQRDRIDVVLGITTKATKRVGYNQVQSKIAIGSGRMWGKGYLQGTQTKYSFVPEQSTDFIFCTIGEEWGFAGSIVVVGLYLFLLIRIVFLAERQRSPFSRIYAYGVASVIFFHFFINISMTVGFMPVIGIPLPLISYGGSSLLSFTILLFTLIKLDSNRIGIV